MANSWEEYKSCIDLKHPHIQKGNVAKYELVLMAKNLKSVKVDADEVKKKMKIVDQIADAFFFISEQATNREKIMIVETKGTDFEHAIKQLAAGYKMLSPLGAEMHGRIVGRSIPGSVKAPKEYLQLQQLFGGKVISKSKMMIETFSYFETSTIK